MNALRPQGRPRRGAAEVGRERIILRLQSVFRSGAVFDLSRKALAELAGVTPALISYYFPKKEFLLNDISEPVLAAYRLDVESIIGEDAPDDSKLRRIIALLVKLYSNDGFILDIYMGMSKKLGRAGDPRLCQVAQMTLLLSNFLSRWRGNAAEEGFDAAVLQGAVWGMCRFAARIDAESAMIEDEASPLVARTMRLLFPADPSFTIARM